MFFNLLDEPIIRYDTVGGSRAEASLPEVYEALMADSVGAFPALRPHQRHAWHAFLVQLGALALYRSAPTEPPADSARWATALRGLTDRFPADDPWCLVVSDITRPAFLQPPATSAERERDYKRSVSTPDELDMLRTAKNHDLKSAVAIGGKTDDWLFALVTVQTMDGFEGSGNYGISRMNKGTGNRPALSLAPMGGVGAHVRRDMVALLHHRTDTIEALPRGNSLHALLWTIPWDGTTEEGLSIGNLDPLYIEICRRIRLYADSGDRLQARRATSKGPRVEARHLNGMTGDPWTPVNKKEGKSLTLAAGGFTYQRIVDYLTPGDYQQPVLLKPTRDERAASRDMLLVARAMVRGQGKTKGYYERSVPLRSRVVRALGTVAGTESLGDMSRKRIEQIRIVQRILSHAIRTFIARGRSENIRREDRRLARPWLDQLDAAVNADFFEALQTEFEASPEDRPAVRRLWLLGIVDKARILVRDAANALPCPAAYRYRARTSAEALFEGRLRGSGGLPMLFTEDKP